MDSLNTEDLGKPLEEVSSVLANMIPLPEKTRSLTLIRD